MTQAVKKIHEGRNIKRFREMLSIKQDALAFELGEDWNQQKISLLEQKETIDISLLKQISGALKVPVEAFQNFDEEQAVNIIASTINNNDNAVMHGPSIYSNQPTFNIDPAEKWLEALEEIKKLNEEKIALYERMLKDKEEMISRLEQVLKPR